MQSWRLSVSNFWKETNYIKRSMTELGHIQVRVRSPQILFLAIWHWESGAIILSKTTVAVTFTHCNHSVKMTYCRSKSRSGTEYADGKLFSVDESQNKSERWAWWWFWQLITHATCCLHSRTVINSLLKCVMWYWGVTLAENVAVF